MSESSWNHLFQIASIILGSGLLIIAGKILMEVGAWREWVKNIDRKITTIDKEVASHGALLQQYHGTIQRILGWLEGKKNNED
jgi:hypothetical protein